MNEWRTTMKGESPESSILRLPGPEEVSVMSLRRYLERVQQCKAERTLSSVEGNVIRRDTRLIKNREGARRSRLRQKDYIESLEHMVFRLREENHRLVEECRTNRCSVCHSTTTRITPEPSYDTFSSDDSSSSHMSYSSPLPRLFEEIEIL